MAGSVPLPCVPSPSSKGIYNHVRMVVDLQDMYYLAGEYYGLQCLWWHIYFMGFTVAYIYLRRYALLHVLPFRILFQLPDGVRAHFPVILTRKYACDISVFSLLRGRTLGNSPNAFRNDLQEMHSEEWLRHQLVYLQRLQAPSRYSPIFQPATPRV